LRWDYSGFAVASSLSPQIAEGLGKRRKLGKLVGPGGSLKAVELRC
jgi:hypothetical protein